jgi:5-methylthioadenosine/S-adenosylhomocysteine deaminase
MLTADLILHARWIIPVEPKATVLENHSIVIKGEQIIALIATDDVAKTYQAKQQKNLPSHVLFPGFVNSHCHSAMSLLRGLADDLPLMEWLEDHIWPAEKVCVSEEFVEQGTRYAAAEMLMSGTTAVNEMYFFPDTAANVFAEVGMRAMVGVPIMNWPTAWAENEDEYFEKALLVVDEFKSHPLIKICFAPHAPYTVTEQMFQRISTLSNQLDIPMHIHLQETAQEIDDSIEQYGLRPTERLLKHGLMGPKTLAVHVTALNDADIAMFAEHKVNAIHCPESNLKLASGFSPVQKMLDAGVNVALGTDGAASNNELDMLGEMKTASMLAKAVAGDATALNAHQSLEMATLSGAKALGIDDITGSLVAGKKADIVAMDMNDIYCQPIDNPISQLVYSSARSQITDVWVGGHHLLNNGELTTIDKIDVIEKARKWRRKMRSEI